MPPRSSGPALLLPARCTGQEGQVSPSSPRRLLDLDLMYLWGHGLWVPEFELMGGVCHGAESQTADGSCP